MSFVPQSVLKQKARQLKKEKSLAWHRALDEAASFYGFTNYKNYQNLSEENRQELTAYNALGFEFVIQQKQDESSERLKLTNSLIQSFKLPFEDLLDLLKEPRNSEKDVQSICESRADLLEYIELHLIKDFLEDESGEIADFALYHIAKKVSLKNLVFTIDHDDLRVEGSYDLILEFGFEYDAASKDDFFEDRQMFGSFDLTINKSKKVIMGDQTIGHYL